MSKQWYVIKEQQKKGPFTREGLTEMIRSGEIDPETLVWTEGMTDWTKGEFVEDLFQKSVSTLPPPPIAHVGSQSVSGTAPMNPTAPIMQTGTTKKQFSTIKTVGKIIVLILGVVLICHGVLTMIGALSDSDTLKSTSVDGARVQFGSVYNDDLLIISPEVKFEAGEQFYISFNNNAPFDTNYYTLRLVNNETNELYDEADITVDPLWTIVVTDLVSIPDTGKYKFSCIVNEEVRATQEVIIE